ncbi:hypothetical protein PAMA_008019 [Pampus argenteus]
MNCSRVLHALSRHHQPAVGPADFAMCLSLSQRQPLYQLLSMSPLTPTQRRYQPSDCPPRTGLHFPHPSSSSSSSSLLSSSPVPPQPRSCFRRDSGSLHKKRVVFADAKGLALTAVRLFIPEPSHTSTLLMKPPPATLQGQRLISNKLQRYKLRLGFPQPFLDFKAYLARLQEMRVQLESCNISEHSLSGKVRVCHASTETAVHIRVTFDSWRSHHDVPCTFLQHQHCGGSETDVFAFDLILPKNIDPKSQIEFCVSFRVRPGATPHWDNNRGQNYRVCIEKDKSDVNQGHANYNHPTLSKHQHPSWPSHMSLGIQNPDDLQYLQRSFYKQGQSRVETLCSTK